MQKPHDHRPHGALAPGMRGERDRFVAFAFCSADILLELDARHVVTYAGGATMALTGRSPAMLLGASLFDLVAPNDHDLLRGVLERAANGLRIEQTGVRLLGPSGQVYPLTLGGYYLPDLGGHYFLSLRMDGARTAPPLDLPGDSETGLPDATGFSEKGAERLREAERQGQAPIFTLVGLEGLTRLRERLNAEARGELMWTLGSALRESSLGGDTAGNLSGDFYGLLHESTVDVKLLESKIDKIAAEADPEGRGIEVKTAAVDMGSRGLDGTDAARAFVHAVKSFEQLEGDKITIESLSQSLSSQMDETAKRIGSTRSVINARAFDIAFQPIVNLTTREIHHFEALVRFRDGESASPFQFVQFAEQVGMVREFDIAMCRRVIAWLELARKADKAYAVAVNLSGRSFGSIEFVAELHSLLKQNDWLKGQLLFEITESANIANLVQTNAIIQSLRKAGFRVCLDDFGAGESAFHYLRALDIDMVKIDGSYVRDALAQPKNRYFLKAISGLCTDLGIDTIAEMIEQEKTIALVQTCGVKFGQGYFFGRPSLDITSFDVRRSLGARKETASGGRR
jgi:EAL domain-containing protein (putative c-di-GMP-specific phosphodiesterase class I)